MVGFIHETIRNHCFDLYLRQLVNIDFIYSIHAEGDPYFRLGTVDRAKCIQCRAKIVMLKSTKATDIVLLVSKRLAVT